MLRQNMLVQEREFRLSLRNHIPLMVHWVPPSQSRTHRCQFIRVELKQFSLLTYSRISIILLPVLLS